MLMETESYILFIVWAILGLVYFRVLILLDKKREYQQIHSANDNDEASAEDYKNIDELAAVIGAHNEETAKTGGVVIACGMARFENDEEVAVVFEQADQNMYANKSFLKEGSFGS